MPPIRWTYRLIHAAAVDAGHRHARQHGRTKWTRADYNAFAREFSRLATIRDAQDGKVWAK